METKKIEWQEAIRSLRDYVVKISTPEGFGTGFLVYYSNSNSMCGIATAAHVINRVNTWQQPIRIDHFISGKSIFLNYSDRAIILDQKSDTAAIIFNKNDLSLPNSPLDFPPEAKHLSLGVEVGWLGFPAIRSDQLCFFSGRISCYIDSDQAYLVDGVAINGVSGGPAFFIPRGTNKITLVGLVSAYIANRATGESLPGLSVIMSVSGIRDMVKEFRTLDEAKNEEVNPSENTNGEIGGTRLDPKEH